MAYVWPLVHGQFLRKPWKTWFFAKKCCTLHSILSIHDKSFKFLLYMFKLIITKCHLSVLKNVYPLPRYSGSSYPTYVRFYVQTRIANKAWELAEILTAYSSDIGLRNISAIFPFWKVSIHCRDISGWKLPYVRTLNFCARKIRFAM